MTAHKDLFFKGYGRGHPLDWRIEDSDAPRAIQLVGKVRPPAIDSTKFIDVQIGLRSVDDQWSLLFLLNDDSFSDIFLIFCKDMVENSWNVSANSAFEYAAERYRQWIQLFAKARGTLNPENIQGLLGEMLVIRDILLPKYGEEVTLNSWMNALLGKQDFVCPDMWYEVKSVLVGRNTVTISSLDQLDRDDPGELVVVELRKTSSESTTGLTINSLYEEIKNIISSNFSRQKFKEILKLIGYSYMAEYESQVFELIQLGEYNIEADFPRIRRSEMRAGIADAKYDILLDGIKKFKVGKWS